MAITNAKALAVYIKDEYRKATGGQEISPIRLQKALYFCFAYWGGFVRKGKNAKQLSEVDLDQVDEILFDDPIEAWVYGPVIPNVYKADKEGTLEKNRLPIEELFKDINIKSYIDGILKDLFEVSDFTLVDIAHNDSSWKNNFDFKELMHNNVIGKEEIIQEYASR